MSALPDRKKQRVAEAAAITNQHRYDLTDNGLCNLPPVFHGAADWVDAVRDKLTRWRSIPQSTDVILSAIAQSSER